MRDVIGRECYGARKTPNDTPCTGPIAELMGPQSSHGIPYNDPEYLDKKHILLFIRHPVTWLQSYWAFRQNSVNINFTWGDTPFDLTCQADTFAGFIELYLDNYSGFITSLFNQYIKEADRDVMVVVGYQEKILSTLFGFLLKYEDFQLDPPKQLYRVNASDKRAAIYAPGQVKRVCKAERQIVDNFYQGYRIYDDVLQELTTI